MIFVGENSSSVSLLPAALKFSIFATVIDEIVSLQGGLWIAFLNCLIKIIIRVERQPDG